MYTNFSFDIRLSYSFYGPLRIPSDTIIDKHPREKRLANLVGINIINGKKVKEMNIKIIPIPKNIANYFQEFAAS